MVGTKPHLARSHLPSAPLAAPTLPPPWTPRGVPFFPPSFSPSLVGRQCRREALTSRDNRHVLRLPVTGGSPSPPVSKCPRAPQTRAVAPHLGPQRPHAHLGGRHAQLDAVRTGAGRVLGNGRLRAHCLPGAWSHVPGWGGAGGPGLALIGCSSRHVTRRSPVRGGAEHVTQRGRGRKGPERRARAGPMHCPRLWRYKEKSDTVPAPKELLFYWETEWTQRRAGGDI
ncbi:uncharacterized protein [Notamacropus eugenii]|uniref:uncharacterized protein n=1 Tax=Notamacropus eugenii TaxID=9315 RepID=UPI003B66C350